MKTNTPPICLTCLLLLASFAGPLAAAESERALPRWFEEHQVQAHLKMPSKTTWRGSTEKLHPAIRSMGAEALTRIFKTTAKGAGGRPPRATRTSRSTDATWGGKSPATRTSTA